MRRRRDWRTQPRTPAILAVVSYVASWPLAEEVYDKVPELPDDIELIQDFIRAARKLWATIPQEVADVVEGHTEILRAKMEGKP